MLKIIGVAILFTCVCIQTVSANTVSYSSGPFSASLQIRIIDIGNLSGSFPTTVTGIPKFDPALGTLNSISFDVMPGVFNWEAELTGETTGVDFEAEFSGFIQADLTYFDSISNLVLVGVSDSIDLSCSGGMDDGCSDEISNDLNFDTGFNVPRTLNEFLSGDIIGSGDITNFQLSVAVFNEMFDTNFGLDELEVTGFGEITDATVHVTYDFTPIPVPAAVWFLSSGLLTLFGIKKYKVAKS